MNIVKTAVFVLCFLVLTLVVGLFCMPILLFGSKNMCRKIAVFWCCQISNLLKNINGIDVEIEGLEYILNSSKTCIILSKHVSAWETFYLFYLLKGRAVFILKKELLAIPIFGWFLYRLDMIGIDRKKAKQAVKKIIHKSSHASKNDHIIIFPQGTRVRYDASYSLDKYPYKRGFMTLQNSLKNTVEYVPSVNNSHLYFGRGFFSVKRSGLVRLVFIPPLEILNQDNKNSSEKIIDVIEKNMLKLLKTSI